MMPPITLEYKIVESLEQSLLIRGFLIIREMILVGDTCGEQYGVIQLSAVIYDFGLRLNVGDLLDAASFYTALGPQFTYSSIIP